MKLDIKTKIKSIKSFKDNKHFIIAFILLVGISIYVSHVNNSEKVSGGPIQADTIIPKGFILFPIQLENIDAIKGVINQFGVIDIYARTKNGSASKKLLSKVKIIQAPYNPDEYALLLPEYLSQKMMSEMGPFLGVIQNKSMKADFVVPESKHPQRKINIEYQGS
jgi:uncharacterized membrane protein